MQLPEALEATSLSDDLYDINNKILQRSHQGLRGLLEMSKETFCADLRDRVYGVLGLLDQSNEPDPIVPDYTLSREELYMQVLRFVQRHDDQAGQITVGESSENTSDYAKALGITFIEMDLQIERALPRCCTQGLLNIDKGLRILYARHLPQRPHSIRTCSLLRLSRYGSPKRKTIGAALRYVVCGLIRLAGSLPVGSKEQYISDGSLLVEDQDRYYSDMGLLFSNGSIGRNFRIHSELFYEAKLTSLMVDGGDSRPNMTKYVLVVSTSNSRLGSGLVGECEWHDLD